MDEIRSGIRSVLSAGWVYNFFQYLIGDTKARLTFVNEYLRPRDDGMRVLDVGCGTGTMVRFLPASMNYTGIDHSSTYIKQAISQYGHRGHFSVCKAERLELTTSEPFDLIILNGLLHHIGDDDALRLLDSLKDFLSEGGRAVTLDPCWCENQHRVARQLVKWDRGQHVRSEKGYLQLANSVYPSVTSTLRNDMLRIPYTHFIMECQSTK